MNRTGIEWTDLSVNPLRARYFTGAVGHYCEKISQGCTHCYSSRFQPRFGLPEFGSGQHLGEVEPFLDEAVLRQVLKRRKPARIFWCDMTDLFGHWVPTEWIDQCFAVMAATPHLTHQVLTKRADRLNIYTTQRYVPGRINDAAIELLGMLAPVADQWPLPNVWLGVSVEDQKNADARRAAFKAVKSAVKFVSYEPAISGVDWTGWEFVDQIISGGESGNGARPTHPDWHRTTRDFCRANGIAYFLKQWGEWCPVREWISREKVGNRFRWTAQLHNGIEVAEVSPSPETYIWHYKEHDPANDSEFASVRLGKKSSGRTLDGREWNEMPAAT